MDPEENHTIWQICRPQNLPPAFPGPMALMLWLNLVI
jgi:hypothetical protein